MQEFETNALSKHDNWELLQKKNKTMVRKTKRKKGKRQEMESCSRTKEFR